VDSSGQLLGITNPAPGQTNQAGLVYVTPIDTAMADVTWMIKNGHGVSHPWLGVLQATDVAGPGAQRFGVPGAVQVDTVASGSPAARVGIADNDVITSVAGHNVSSVGALIAWMATAKPGQVMSIAWVHDGHRRKANVTLGMQPATASPS
jgi:S1-C subfamily serine protease